MEYLSEQRLIGVNPQLAALIRKLDDQFRVRYPDSILRVTQALRTWDEQADLYAQGRTEPGPIVTNAPPGHSYHNLGLAVDLVPMSHGQAIWDTEDARWAGMVALGTALGLTSGACWQSIKDFPHFQLEGSLPVSPDDATRALYAKGGVEAVWEAAGLVDTDTKDA